MKTSSCKAKGRALQNLVRDKLRVKFHARGNDPVDTRYGLVEEDITSRPMGSSGTDLILTPSAQRLIPYDIECKAQESLNLWSAWEQTVANTKPGRKPLLIVKRNRSEVLAIQRLEDVI